MKMFFPIIRFVSVFVILYWVFKKMFIRVNVSMTGWQFIVFIIVLVAIVEYLIERWAPRKA